MNNVLKTFQRMFAGWNSGLGSFAWPEASWDGQGNSFKRAGQTSGRYFPSIQVQIWIKRWKKQLKSQGLLKSISHFFSMLSYTLFVTCPLFLSLYCFDRLYLDFQFQICGVVTSYLIFQSVILERFLDGRTLKLPVDLISYM